MSQLLTDIIPQDFWKRNRVIELFAEEIVKQSREIDYPEPHASDPEYWKKENVFKSKYRRLPFDADELYLLKLFDLKDERDLIAVSRFAISYARVLEHTMVYNSPLRRLHSSFIFYEISDDKKREMLREWSAIQEKLKQRSHKAFIEILQAEFPHFGEVDRKHIKDFVDLLARIQAFLAYVWFWFGTEGKVKLITFKGEPFEKLWKRWKNWNYFNKKKTSFLRWSVSTPEGMYHNVLIFGHKPTKKKLDQWWYEVGGEKIVHHATISHMYYSGMRTLMELTLSLLKPHIKLERVSHTKFLGITAEGMPKYKYINLMDKRNLKTMSKMIWRTLEKSLSITALFSIADFIGFTPSFRGGGYRQLLIMESILKSKDQMRFWDEMVPRMYTWKVFVRGNLYPRFKNYMADEEIIRIAKRILGRRVVDHVMVGTRYALETHSNIYFCWHDFLAGQRKSALIRAINFRFVDEPYFKLYELIDKYNELLYKQIIPVLSSKPVYALLEREAIKFEIARVIEEQRDRDFYFKIPQSRVQKIIETLTKQTHQVDSTSIQHILMYSTTIIRCPAKWLVTGTGHPRYTDYTSKPIYSRKNLQDILSAVMVLTEQLGVKTTLKNRR